MLETIFICVLKSHKADKSTRQVEQRMWSLYSPDGLETVFKREQVIRGATVEETHLHVVLGHAGAWAKLVVEEGLEPRAPHATKVKRRVAHVELKGDCLPRVGSCAVGTRARMREVLEHSLVLHFADHQPPKSVRAAHLQ